ncbi:MAG: hypothetical protein WD266_09930 [Balneolales bacterium]
MDRLSEGRVPWAAFLALSVIPALIPGPAEAQQIMGARGIGLAGAVTALADYEWSVFQNPAMMPETDSHISFFTIRYYGLSELTDSALSGVFNASYGTLGIGLNSYGFDLYRESQFRLAFMRSFADLRLGAVMHYQHVAIEGYGSAGTPSVNLGFAMKLSDDFWLGARAANLTRATLGDAGEELPRELAVGLSFLLSERVLFVSDLVKDVQFPFAYRGGMEAALFQDFLYLRGGVSTAPLTFSLGLGFTRSFWAANVAAQHHEWLGWSPGLDFKTIW